MEKKTLIILEIIGIALAAILVGSVGGGSIFFGDFNLIDEGQFAAWANHMLLGKKMFRDIYITYGPFLVYPLYLLFKLFGPSLFLVRVYMLIGSIFGLIITLFIMYQLRIPKGIRYFLLMIMILLPVMQLRQGLALFCLYLLARAIEKVSARWYVAVGIATAITFLASPDMGVFVILIELVVFAWAIFISKRIVHVGRSSFFTFLGASIVLVSFGAWAASEGWLGAYLSTTADLFSSFSGINLPNGMGFPNLFVIMPKDWNFASFAKFIVSKEALLYWGLLFYIVTFLFILIVSLKDNSLKATKDVFLLSLLGFFMYSILIGRWGIGHFFFILSPILLIGGYYASRLLEVNNKIFGNRIISIGLLLVLSLFALRILLINRPQIAATIAGLPKVVNSKSELKKVGPVVISDQQSKYFTTMLSFVDTNIGPNEGVYFLSNEPVFYMLLHKPNPTRYDLPYIAITKAKRYEVLSDLKKQKPTYIFENAREWAVDGISNRKRMPEVSAYIEADYILLKEQNGVKIYQYKTSKE